MHRATTGPEQTRASVRGIPARGDREGALPPTMDDTGLAVFDVTRVQNRHWSVTLVVMKNTRSRPDDEMSHVGVSV